MTEDNQRIVISRLRTGPVWLGIVIVVVAGGFSIWHDLRGSGGNQTLLFETTGQLAYPIYYGVLIACLIMGFRTLRLKDEWITASDREITIGGRKMSAEDLRNVEVRQNWIGLNRLVLLSRKGPELATKTFLLESPLSKVVPELRARINERFDQPSLTTFEA